MKTRAGARRQVELVNALRLKVFRGDIKEADTDAQVKLFQGRKERGLLEETILIFAGEFGRTPFSQGSNERGSNSSK